MTTPVCVDSSFVLKLALPEKHSPDAVEHFSAWTAEGRPVIAPSLLAFEVTSVLRGAMLRRGVDRATAIDSLNDFLAIPIRLLRSPDLHRRAFELADELGLSAAYDAHYLAVAEAHECEFWTADEKLYNAVKDKLSWVKWIGNAPSNGNSGSDEQGR